MAYEKQNWEKFPSTETPITAERLNHMEDGIEEAWNHGGGGGAGETLPIGSEIDFDGNVSDIPDGWEQADDLIQSLTLTGTTNQNGEVDITSLNSNLIPSKVVILQVAVTDKIPSVNTNSTGSNLFVMFRNRGTTYSPVAQNTSITFTIYYIKI